MGADIYLFDNGQKDIRDDQITGFVSTEGYYRDAYNGSSIARKLGFSWWQDVGDLMNKCGKYVDDDSEKGYHYEAHIERPEGVFGNLFGAPLVEFRDLVQKGIDENLYPALEALWAEHKADICKAIRTPTSWFNDEPEGEQRPDLPESECRAEYFKGYVDDAYRLLAMIQKAIDENGSLYCSI